MIYLNLWSFVPGSVSAALRITTSQLLLFILWIHWNSHLETQLGWNPHQPMHNINVSLQLEYISCFQCDITLLNWFLLFGILLYEVNNPWKYFIFWELGLLAFTAAAWHYRCWNWREHATTNQQKSPQNIQCYLKIHI